MMEPGPRFTGFTIPAGAWVPPELIFALPSLTESQLKVLLVILYNDLQTGGNEPSTIETLEEITGLARSSVHDALRRLVGTELVVKASVGKANVYSASVRISDTKLSKLNKKESKDVNSLTDSLNYDNRPESVQERMKFGLVSELRTLGVYFVTARKLVEEIDEATIRKHVMYFQYALEKRMATTPGWLVLSLREKWGPPLGYEEAREKDYTGGQYADYIKS